MTRRLAAVAGIAGIAGIALMACAPAAHAQQEVRHTVAAGDTLMGIAQRYLGDAALWREVQRLNPHTRNDRLLRVGSTVIVPLPPPGPVAVHVNGRATYTRDGQARELTQGLQLQEKDSVDVQDASYVTLRWPEGMVTHLLPGSSLRLVPPATLATPRPQLLELRSGTAESRIPPGVPGRSFQIRTRLGTAAVRGTGFGVRLADAMVTDVTDGAVQLAAQGAQPLELPAGTGAVADASGRQPQAVPLLPAPQIQEEPVVTTDGFVRAASVPGAVRYEFELAPAAAPDATLRRVASETPVFPLQPLREGNWRARVRAVDAQGIPGMPAASTFAALAFPAPAPVVPANDAVLGQDVPGRFMCSEVPGAVRYEIEIHSLDAQREVVRLSAAPNCETAVPLLPTGRYRWLAFSLRDLGGGRLLRSQPGPSARFSVVTRPAAPVPGLRPASGEQQIVAWEGTPGASHLVQVARDTSFAALVSEVTVTSPQAAVIVQAGRTVYVRIRTIAASGVASDFSQPLPLRGPQ